MTPSNSLTYSSSAPETQTEERSVLREDVQWNRPLFRAPPLHVDLPTPDLLDFSSQSQLQHH